MPNNQGAQQSIQNANQQIAQAQANRFIMAQAPQVHGVLANPQVNQQFQQAQARPQTPQIMPNAHYGVLANPQARVDFYQTTRPTVFNPFNAGASSAYGYLKSIPAGVVNTGQVPLDVARVASANISGNAKALANAQKAVASDAQNNLFSPDVPFLKSVAATALNPVSGHYSNQEAARATNELSKAYGVNPQTGQPMQLFPKGQADLEASLVKQKFLQDQLQRAGLNQNDSLARTALKVGAQGGQLAANTIMQAQMGNSFMEKAGLGELNNILNDAYKPPVAPKIPVKTASTNKVLQAVEPLAKSAASNGLINAGSNVLSTAQQDNKGLGDYVQAGVQGFGQGAALSLGSELAGHAIGKSVDLATSPAGKAAAKQVSQNLDLSRVSARRQQQETVVQDMNKAISHAQQTGDVATARKLIAQRTTEGRTLARLRAQELLLKQNVGMSTQRVNDAGEPIGPSPSKSRTGKPASQADANAISSTGSVADPLTALKQEALKYKSADEFVNSHSPVYHGTSADLKDISQLQSGRQRGEYSSGTRSIFASENPELASKYGNNVLEGRNTGKVLDTTKLGDPHDPNNMVVPKEFSDYKTNPTLDATDRRVLENSYFKGGTPSNIIIDHKPNIQEYFRSKGYSAIQIPRGSDVGGPTTEMTIIDPGKIQTRQQLTDLYNQAHSEKGAISLTDTPQSYETRTNMSGSPQAVIQQISHPFNTIGEKLDALKNRNPNTKFDDYKKLYFTDKEIATAKQYGLDLPSAKEAYQAHAEANNQANSNASVPKGNSDRQLPNQSLPESLSLAERSKQLSSNPSIAEQSKGVIIKETKPRNGRQDVVRAVLNPETGKLEPRLETIDAPTSNAAIPAPKAPKTGVVDKQLKMIEESRKSVVNTAADELMQQNPRNLKSEVLKNGGISSTAYETYPKGVVRKSGMTADKMAQVLGFPDENTFMEALNNQGETLNRTQARELAQQQLESGKHAYSADYQQMTDALKQRQDELSLYPNGKYRQVKVTNKPGQMTDAELQSLAGTPEGSTPKNTNKVTQRNEKIAVRNIEAERQVQSILKKGGHSDEAIHAYMTATGADLQTAVHDVRRVAQESKLGFNAGKNPLEGSIKIPTVSKGDADQAFLNADYVKQHETTVGQKALDAYRSLSPKDQVLLKEIETDTVANVAKQAKDPKAFQQAEQAIRTYYDTRHAFDKTLGIDVGYRTNYLRQLFAKAEEEAKANLPDQTSIKAGNKRPGYTQKRAYDTLHTDVGNALERDIATASNNHARLAYARGLTEAFPQDVNTSGELVRGKNGNYLQLQNRYGEGITADRSIAQHINSRASVDTTNRFLKGYDATNRGLKYVKLGGGAFHAVTEAGNFVGQQLTSGKLFTEPGATGKVIKSFFSPKTMDREMAAFREKGTLDNAAIAGLKTAPKEILADANVNIKGKLAKYTGIQALHDATFQREIPYAKLKMFEQRTEGLDVNNPADLVKMRQSAREINQIFGGINRDIQGINRKAFTVLQRGVLATDFTEGKIHTVLDALHDRTEAGTLARQTIVGKALLFGALASAGGAVGGEYKGKDAKQIAETILGKLADPSFRAGKYKVSLPSTHISEFSRPLVPLVKPATTGSAKGDRFAGLQHYGTSRLAAVPSEILQLRTNKDYSGNRIYGKDYKSNGGKQISPLQTVGNIASGVVPIPFSQAHGVMAGQQNIPAAIANTAGLRVTDESKYATPTKTAQGVAGAGYNFAKNADGTYSVTVNGKTYKEKNKADALYRITRDSLKNSNNSTVTVGGQMFHKTASGEVQKGAPAVPRLPGATTTTSTTTYDPKTNTWTRIAPITGKTVSIDSSGMQTVIKPGIGTIRGARPDYVNNIHAAAQTHGVDPYAVMSVAAQEGLGGGVGDGGTSFGPFQLHVGGALPPGKDQAWAESPAGIDYAMQRIAEVTKGKTGADAIKAIVYNFERPADPATEYAKALAVYNGQNASVTGGSPRSATLATTRKTGSTKSAGSYTAPKSAVGNTPKTPKFATSSRSYSAPKLRTSKISTPAFKVAKARPFKLPKTKKYAVRRSASSLAKLLNA